MKNKIENYDILECTQSLTYEIGDETFTVEKGKCYCAFVDPQEPSIIKTYLFEPYNKRNVFVNYRNNLPVFTTQSNIFDLPNIKSYFKILIKHEEKELIKLHQCYESNGYRGYKSCNYNEIIRSNDDRPYSTLALIDGKPVRMFEESIKAFKYKSVVNKHIKILSIDASLNKYNKEYTGNLDYIKITNVHDLNISNNDEHDKLEYKISYPKSLRKLRVDNCIIDVSKIPNNVEIDAYNTHIKNLTVKDLERINLRKCTIENFDGDMFTTELNVNDYKNDNLANLSILKIDDDNYKLTDSEKVLNKEELATFCYTFQLYEAIELFNLPKNRFQLSYTDYHDGFVEVEQFPFIKENSTFKIRKKGDLIYISEIKFDYYKHSSHLFYDIVNDKFILSGKNIYSDNSETINDNLLNILLKLTEKDIFKPNYFKDFLNECHKTNSKYVGEITIEEFVFSLFANKYSLENIQALVYEDRKWSIVTYGKKLDSYYDNHERCRIQYETEGIREFRIDWGKERFRLKDLDTDEKKVYLNPDYKNYYTALKKYKRDDFAFEVKKMDYFKIDESILYNLVFDESCFEKHGFKIINNKLIIDPKRYENSVDKERAKEFISISDAKDLAKKYKFKLDFTKVWSSNQQYIDYCYVNEKYNRNDNKSPFQACLMDKSFLHQQNNFPIECEDFEVFINHFIKVGDKIFYNLNDDYQEIYLNKETGEVRFRRKNSNIFKELEKTKSFSYINHPFSEKLIREVNKLTNNNAYTDYIQNSKRLKKIDHLLFITQGMHTDDYGYQLVCLRDEIKDYDKRNMQEEINRIRLKTLDERIQKELRKIFEFRDDYTDEYLNIYESFLDNFSNI